MNLNLLFIVLFCFFLPAISCCEDYYMVTSAQVNVRSRPNSKSKILTLLSQGDTVYSISRSGKWIFCQINPKLKGYVSSKNLTKVEQPPKDTQNIIVSNEHLTFGNLIQSTKKYFIFIIAFLGFFSLIKHYFL